MRLWLRHACAIAGACALFYGAAALGQAFPTKPIRVVNPAGPGGKSDIFFRLLQPKMAEALGQPLVMDYRPGASGTIGANVVARSAPDGYTVGIVPASFMINPSVFKKLPYDALRDFSFLGIVVDVPMGLAVHPSLPARNVKEIIALAKKRPGEIFYATAGAGTPAHLGTELLNLTAGIRLVHVPYKGAAQALSDLIAGHVQMQFASMPLLFGHMRSGRLRVIAQTGEARTPSAPEVPTMREQGLREFVLKSLFGLIGPADIPRPVAERLNEALVAAIRDPHNNRMLIERGATPIGSTLEEHAASARAEIERWRKIARAAGVEPQ